MEAVAFRITALNFKEGQLEEGEQGLGEEDTSEEEAEGRMEEVAVVARF